VGEGRNLPLMGSIREEGLPVGGGGKVEEGNESVPGESGNTLLGRSKEKGVRKPFRVGL